MIDSYNLNLFLRIDRFTSPFFFFFLPEVLFCKGHIAVNINMFPFAIVSELEFSICLLHCPKNMKWSNVISQLLAKSSD